MPTPVMPVSLTRTQWLAIYYAMNSTQDRDEIDGCTEDEFEAAIVEVEKAAGLA